MKKAIYIFVRNDLSYSQKVVQSCHAALEATRQFVNNDERYKIVVLAAKSEPKLMSIMMEAGGKGIKTTYFTEPDMDFQVTAVATEPLDDEQRKVFQRYKLLQE